MKTQKCCAHCPGKLTPPGSNESHECCQPRYVSGNLRISSLETQAADCCGGKEEDLPPLPLPENRSSCYDQFAIAKKLHAENLQHQPLPDKLDDSVFKNVKVEGCRCGGSSKKCCDCCKTEVAARSARYGPALGCKKPKSKMDLAICWETPVDSRYEPSRPAHIDGSEGGVAPAIFTLVQRTSSRASIDSSSSKNGRCASQEGVDSSRNESKQEDNKSGRCCWDCLCKDLNGVKISRKNKSREFSGKECSRKCVACETWDTREDPRLIRSAVGLAIGAEKPGNVAKRTGSKSAVPRPRTPFARRSFCIDTLSPPFSVVNGCRDSDFPEHWRLMSVYQQSYRNPYRRRVYRY